MINHNDLYENLANTPDSIREDIHGHDKTHGAMHLGEDNINISLSH